MKDPFGGRAGWLVAAAAVGLALTIGFGLFSNAPSAILSPKANSFSRSIIGFHGFVAFLEAMEIPVHVSRYQTMERLVPGAALVVLAPSLDEDGLDRATDLIRDARERKVPVVVVMAQWRISDLHKRSNGWVGLLDSLPKTTLEANLVTLLDLESESTPRLSRPSKKKSLPLETEFLEFDGLRADLPQPQLLRQSEALEGLLSTEGSRPQVEGTEKQSLIAKLLDEPVWIVSDPDLINNGGLGRGDNAAIFHRLLTEQVGVHTVMIDETHHGFLEPPSIWRQLTTFPLNLVSLHLLLLLVAAVWAAARRFGRPQPAPPRVAPGAGVLIDNTARLVRIAGHMGDTVQRYFQLIVRDTAQRCALPPNLEFSEQVEHLEKLGKARGLEQNLRRVASRIDTIPAKPQEHRLALALCRELADWRKEITNGFR